MSSSSISCSPVLLQQAMKAHAGKYVCIVEGAIPTKDNGIYCMVGGRTA